MASAADLKLEAEFLSSGDRSLDVSNIDCSYDFDRFTCRAVEVIEVTCLVVEDYGELRVFSSVCEVFNRRNWI